MTKRDLLRSVIIPLGVAVLKWGMAMIPAEVLHTGATQLLAHITSMPPGIFM